MFQSNAFLHEKNRESLRAGIWRPYGNISDPDGRREAQEYGGGTVRGGGHGHDRILGGGQGEQLVLNGLHLGS